MEQLAKQLRGKVVFAYMPDHMRGKPGVKIDQIRDNVIYVAPAEGSELTNAQLHDLIAGHIKEKHERKISVSIRETGIIETNHSRLLQTDPAWKPLMRTKFFKISSSGHDGDALLEELAKRLNA
jgi:hypothetical protein